jgi:putative ABC transport system substrate-binding protein
MNKNKYLHLFPVRRRLLTAGAALPLLALAASPVFAQQKGKVWRIGILSPRARPAAADSDQADAFMQGLRELNYVEGKNISFVWRFADDKVERLQGLARELVQLKVDVIVTGGTPAALAARQATRSIPIVVAAFGDPVESGLAASLARPGGNVTGQSNLSGELDAKRLEILMSAAPRAGRIAQLVNPDNVSTMSRIQSLRVAAHKAGREFLPVEARVADDLDAAFTRMERERAGALLISNYFSSSQSPRIAALALRYRLPTMFANRLGVDAGGLMSYGPDVADMYRRAATLVDKIFKGAKPGDLPIEQPTKFDVAVNMKTARLLGVTLPQTILVLANRVIE